MTDRLALLRAILAAPDDDVPRLVYADWLDEYGETDADAARAEFIRLGCKMRGGRRPISTDQAAWLRHNWQRLLPAVLAIPRPEDLRVRWKGRFLAAQVVWDDDHDEPVKSWLFPDFVRGFVRRVQFKHPRGYARFWRAVVADEPLAALEPQDLPPWHGTWRNRTVSLAPAHWGRDVFDRVAGHDQEPHPGLKVFVTRPQDAALPLELRDPQYRARRAVGAAMTALARELAGLAPVPAAPPGPA